MLQTHRQVEVFQGHGIYQRQPGFEFTPITLGKIASFLVRAPDGRVTIFAFLYSLLAELDGPVDERRLLSEAVTVVRSAIVSRETDEPTDRTFEYHEGRFVAVEAPRWWVPTSP